MDPKHDDTAAGSVEGIGLDRIASSGQNSVRAIVPGVCKCEILRLVRTDDHVKPLSKAATSCGLTQHDQEAHGWFETLRLPGVADYRNKRVSGDSKSEPLPLARGNCNHLRLRDLLAGILISLISRLRNSFQSSPVRARTSATSNHKVVVRDSALSLAMSRPFLEIIVQKSRKPLPLALVCDFSASPARLYALLTSVPPFTSIATWL